MRTKTRWAILLVVVILFVAAFISGMKPASAAGEKSGYDGDTQHCVVPREVWIINKALPRKQIEIRWEMVGRGEKVDLLGELTWVYKMCGEQHRFATIAPSKNYVEIGIFDDGNYRSFRALG